MLKTKYYTIYEEKNYEIKAYEIEGTLNNLANLIATNYSSNLRVYNDRGDFIVSTIGCFLDRVADPDTRQELLYDLMPLQLGEIEPKEVIYIDDILKLRREA